MLERVLVCLLARRSPADRRRAGSGQDAHGQDDRRACSAAASNRIQFTPDLVPSDLVGTRIYRPGDGDVRHGARARLLQLPAGRRDQPGAGQGAVGPARGHAGAPGDDRRTRRIPVPDPFLVMATQNPIESEGTYPLPEAQIDRFMLKILVDYPAHDEELTVVQRSLVAPPDLRDALARGAARAPARGRQRSTSTRRVVSYAVALAHGDAPSRPARARRTCADYIAFGASPRGPISLVQAARALALAPRPRLRRSSQDLQELAKDALRHRLVLTYQALAEERQPGRRCSTACSQPSPRRSSSLARDESCVSVVLAALDVERTPAPARARGRCPERLLRALELTIARRDRGPARRRLPLAPRSATAPSWRRSGLRAGRRRPPDRLERHREDGRAARSRRTWPSVCSPPGSCSTPRRR